jgi:hypothetical protein
MQRVVLTSLGTIRFSELVPENSFTLKWNHEGSRRGLLTIVLHSWNKKVSHGSLNEPRKEL